MIQGALEQCPTCKTPRDEDRRWQTGSYKLDGESHPCDCAQQVELLQHYLVARIPDEYMRLDWERNFSGDKRAVMGVETFLDKWEGMKSMGVGIEFTGAGLGIGKTFAATTIAKELVKLGEHVYFCGFNEFLNAARYDKKEELEQIRDSKVLVLDEIQVPPNDKFNSIYASRFEEIVRYRTNYNRVTIMTTNVSEDDIQKYYPRVYSLLRAKQLQVEMEGNDARQSATRNRNLELIMNGEIPPIS